MCSDPARKCRPRFNLVQGTSQQPAIRQQAVDLRQTKRYGRPPDALDAVSPLQSTYLLAQDGQDRALAVVGNGRSKGIWGNDRHRPSIWFQGWG